MIATLIDQKLVKQVFFDGRTRKLKTLFELSDSDNPPSKKVPGSLENAKQPSKKVPSTPEENIPPYRSKKKERDSSGKPESLEEVQGYAKELNADGEEAEKFFDHFTSNGWKVGGRTAMQDWRAAFRNWMRNSVKFGGKKPEKVTEDGLEDTSHYPDHRGLRPGIDFDRPDGKY